MAITLATFNVNNLFLRYRFMDAYPGSPPGKKPPPDLRPLVDDPATSAAKKKKEPQSGFLPMYNSGMFTVFHEDQRKLEALAFGKPDFPDVVCVQEVESMLALREFNQRYLGKHYDYTLVIDGRDLRQIDVGVLSTRKILDVRTHVDDQDQSGLIFRRDLLEVVIELPGHRHLTVFVAHLKSKFTGINVADPAKESAKGDVQRLREAKATAAIIRRRFPGSRFNRELFALCGDFNDEPGSAPVRPVVKQLGLENVIDRLPRRERWTHWWSGRNQASQFDYLLLSPALAKLTSDELPRVERRGIGFRRLRPDGSTLPTETNLVRKAKAPATKVPFVFTRFPDVGPRMVASDHCLVSLKIRT